MSNRRVVRNLCILVAAGLLFVGLWPFDTSPKNRAYWLPNEEGLYFDGHRDRWKLSVGGIAYTPSPLSSLKSAPQEKASFTIELLLRPATEVNNDVPRILSFVGKSGEEAFYLGQWKQWFIVRWFSSDQSGKRRKKEIGVGEALTKDKAQNITVVSNGMTCSIYLNGQLAKSFQDIALIGERESIRGCSVMLGNSKGANSSWTGSILALKLYERALSEREIAENREGMRKSDSREGLIAAFAFDKRGEREISDLSGNGNNLEIPEQIRFTNRVLAWPEWTLQNRAPLMKDMIVNVLGFVPFGFLLALWEEQRGRSSAWRSYVFAVLVGTLISLVIEVTQAYIPVRDSSMVDVICNTAGTAIGAGCWGEGLLGSIELVE